MSTFEKYGRLDDAMIIHDRKTGDLDHVVLASFSFDQVVARYLRPHIGRKLNGLEIDGIWLSFIAT